MNRERFPGLAASSWARLDGPAGTQMVDTAIEAMDAWMRSGRGANHGGVFAAAHATDELVESARASAGALLGAPPDADRLRLQHDRADDGASPARSGARSSPATRSSARAWTTTPTSARGSSTPSATGATVRFAEPEPRDARAARRARSRPCCPSARAGSRSPTPPTPSARSPTSPGIVAAAHDAGARVYVDAVHAAPHRRLDVAALGCDALACSAYKWFGPHIGVQWARPELLAELRPDKLLPSPDTVPDRWENGTLPFEALAGVAAAADYTRGMDWDAVRAHEDALLSRRARRASTRSPASPSTAAPATAPRR